MLEPLFRDALDAQEAPGPGYTVGIPSTAMTFLLDSFGENKWETREQTSHSWNGMDEVVACKMVLVVRSVRCEADRMSAITMMSVLLLGS